MNVVRHAAAAAAATNYDVVVFEGEGISPRLGNHHFGGLGLLRSRERARPEREWTGGAGLISPTVSSGPFSGYGDVFLAYEPLWLAGRLTVDSRTEKDLSPLLGRPQRWRGPRQLCEISHCSCVPLPFTCPPPSPRLAVVVRACAASPTAAAAAARPVRLFSLFKV